VVADFKLFINNLSFTVSKTTCEDFLPFIIKLPSITNLSLPVVVENSFLRALCLTPLVKPAVP